VSDPRDYPTPEPKWRKPQTLDEQAVHTRDTDPAPAAEDMIITALRNMIRDHERTERQVMAELRAGIREDFKEEAARIADRFLEADAERKRELAEVRAELEKLRARVTELEERIEQLEPDGK